MAIEREGLEFLGEVTGQDEEILTQSACALLCELVDEFAPARDRLLAARKSWQAKIDAGALPEFRPETASVRSGDWKVAPLPKDLLDRRVEITGPVDRKMIINALNADVKVFMADFEDALSPTWRNVIEGQANLRDAVRRTILLDDAASGKSYKLDPDPAVLIARVRGLHLDEKHVRRNGKAIPGGLMDFALYLFHNHEQLRVNGSGPYFYVPKLEHYEEARWWNSVFVAAQKRLGLPVGTVKATMLIETLPAVFEMDEILFELKDHAAALNCGRWDYIFSYIKKLREQKDVILPDRSTVTMTAPFMRSYSLLTIKTCHRRGAPAIGGMAAQIPVKNDPVKNEEAFNKVRADKEREARDGHDGTWVAHPGLVPVAMDVFNQEMKHDNQIAEKTLDDLEVSEQDLLEVPQGTITEEGVRLNINVGIQYISSWLSGQGAAPIHNLMEDVATAEISRAQLWQWIRHPKGILDDGRNITIDLYEQLKQEELTKLKSQLGEEQYKNRRFSEAVQLFDQLIQNEQFTDFLTIPGYRIL